jgi:hypothetical protein
MTVFFCFDDTAVNLNLVTNVVFCDDPDETPWARLWLAVPVLKVKDKNQSRRYEEDEEAIEIFMEGEGAALLIKVLRGLSERTKKAAGLSD